MYALRRLLIYFVKRHCFKMAGKGLPCVVWLCHSTKKDHPDLAYTHSPRIGKGENLVLENEIGII